MNASSFYPFSIEDDRSKVKVFEAEVLLMSKIENPQVSAIDRALRDMVAAKDGTAVDSNGTLRQIGFFRK